MFRRKHAIALLCSVPVLAALTQGCSSDTKATPQVIFDSTILHGDGNNCKEDGTFFTVGDFGNQAADTKVATQPIPDQGGFGQGTVSVSCSVTSSGTDEFRVVASVELSGATGGLFRVDGTFKTTGDQANIHAFFSSRSSGNSYDETDDACTMTYSSQFMGVAAGRVWADFTCPHIINAGAQTSCEAQGTFRFENCAQ